MSVKLRQRVKNNKTTLYLDIYDRGKRQLEYLRLYLIDNPKTREERKFNKETLELAENIRARRQLELQSGVYGFEKEDRKEASFLAYFGMLTNKRLDSEGNHGNWNSTLLYLKKWEKGDIQFKNLDSMWLDDLKHYLVHEVQKKNGEKLSQNSCTSYFNKVKAALRQAVKDEIIKVNPAENVEGIKEAETQREFLTLDELKKVLEAKCDIEILKNAFIFGCLTGLRFSDIQKLTWGELHHSEENGYYLRFKQQKTKGQETLPISEDAVSFMGQKGEYAQPVFTDLTYSDYNNSKIREWMIRAGIEKHITFHSSRHTYATLQLTLGTDIYTVSKLLGHKHLKTTEVYAKIIDQKKMEAANRIKLL